jgi:sorbitol/mannitol transport system permease protein
MSDTTLKRPEAADAPAEPEPSSRSAVRRRLGSPLLTAFTFFLAILMVWPAFWMLLTAFKSERAALTIPPTLLFEPTLEQFEGVFSGNFPPYVFNSVFATVVSTAIVLLLALPAAWALSVQSVKRAQDALFFFISTRMLPLVGAVIPIYVISRDLGLLDNVTALTMVYTAMNLPIAIWVLRSFLLEVPSEVIEAAMVDGANLSQLIRKILVPIILPGLAATALICVIFSWNEFLFAVNLTSTSAPTVPVYLVGFITAEGLFWAQLSAAATMASLPVLLAGWFAQKQLVRGLSFGAVK